MAYSGSTNFYSLPYMRTGDYLTQSEEERRAKIIDNLLYVATYGASKAIIEDADYSLTNTKSPFCTLGISSIAGEYTFMAIVNYRLAYRKGLITLQLEQGLMHYIYVTANNTMDTDPTKCGLKTSSVPIRDVNHLLLATVDYTGTEAILDTDTDKQYLTNIAAHTMDGTNPHGTILHQNILEVTKQLLVKDKEIYPYVFYEIASSPGSTPVTIEVIGMTPKFVTAMIGDLDIGYVACKINEDKTISVCNSGVSGKKIILKIEGSYDS